MPRDFNFPKGVVDVCRYRGRKLAQLKIFFAKPLYPGYRVVDRSGCSFRIRSSHDNPALQFQLSCRAMA